MSENNEMVAIIGAGVMGGEIAYVAAAAGIPVVLKDIEQRFLDAGVEKARSIFAFRLKRRRITEEEMKERLSLISTTLDYGAIAGVTFVIEAVPENLDVKRRVFAELETACPDAILASNTSALSITAIAEGVRDPARVAGMHFFNPVSLMRLVEVIRGAKTAPETAARTAALAEAMGKLPVTVADAPGFVVNRLLCAAMLEAVRCEQDGLAKRAEIDSALVKPVAGLPVGLFKMADQLGLDLISKVMHILHDGLGARFSVPREIEECVAAGRLGVKTGAGLYDYSQPASAPESPADATRLELVVSRVLTAVVAEAKRAEAEGVAAPADIDAAMHHGALFKKPPFEYEREVGADAMRGRLEEYAGKFGEQFRI